MFQVRLELVPHSGGNSKPVAAVNGRARAAVGRRSLSWLVFQMRLELVPHSGGQVAGQWQLSEVELMQQ